MEEGHTEAISSDGAIRKSVADAILSPGERKDLGTVGTIREIGVIRRGNGPAAWPGRWPPQKRQRKRERGCTR